MCWTAAGGPSENGKAKYLELLFLRLGGRCKRYEKRVAGRWRPAFRFELDEVGADSPAVRSRRFQAAVARR
jgi:hypothetical protein